MAKDAYGRTTHKIAAAMLIDNIDVALKCSDCAAKGKITTITVNLKLTSNMSVQEIMHRGISKNGWAIADTDDDIICPACLAEYESEEQ